MANRFANLEGSKKISEDFNNINIGFDRVQAEMDTKGTPADAQAKADAAKVAAIAAAAADLAAHKARGADEHPTAKGNAAGFMSAADKLLVDARTSAATPDTLMQRDAAGRAKVAAPIATDDIARKAETDTVQANLDSHATDTNIHVTAADHTKLNGIAAGAEVNQNAFAVINDVEASGKSDTVIFVGGTGITVTTDPEGKRIVLTATGEATPGAHASSHITGGTDVIPDAVIGGSSGLMSGTDAKFVRQDGESKTGAQAKADAAKQAANEYTDGKVAEIVIDDASLTQKGIVQLSDATDGSRSDVAATEKAVGLAFQAGVERKAEVVAALNSIGVLASTSETWDQLISKLAAVIRATGSATPSQVMSGATFSNVTGNNRTGAMLDNGAVTQNITNQNGVYVVPEGYHNGSGVVQAVITNLIAGNIRTGITVGGVPGTFTGSISPGSGPIFRRTNYASSNSSTPYEVVGIVFNLPGTIRISFDLYTSSTNARAQIYKNGVAFGTLRSSSSSTPTTYVQDITFVAGDKISVYLWAIGSSASIEKIIYGTNLLTITQE
ncbi:phage tail protein [Paenibacillus sp. 11B]|uniref:phage tail protein n=1 Tax=unclassified Paenibacillus TaxID=185978 RepID=UPI0026534EB2|nr:phage tail protein [Paenibacillus sp. 11B]MDN8591878.1 phage tail protein [Paenibacillus sp. 11B]